jgi:hypothetical protein
MKKNYLIYPCKILRITQSYTETTSHLPHTAGSPKDYPWESTVQMITEIKTIIRIIK